MMGTKSYGENGMNGVKMILTGENFILLFTTVDTRGRAILRT